MSIAKTDAVKNVYALATYLELGRGARLRAHVAARTDRMAEMWTTSRTLADFWRECDSIPSRTGRSVAAFHLVQSFPAGEFDINNPADVEAVNDLGAALARRLEPDAAVAVVTHVDGAGGCLHSHIVIANDDGHGHACRRARNQHAVRAVNDSLMRERGLSIASQYSAPPVDDWSAIVESSTGDDAESVIRRAVATAMLARPVSFEQFQSEISRGWSLTATTKTVPDSDAVGLVYHVRAGGRERRRKASKLGPSYTFASLSSEFEANAERERQRAALEAARASRAAQLRAALAAADAALALAPEDDGPASSDSPAFGL